MKNITNIKKHSVGQSLFYHLMPGILMGGLYYLIRQPLKTLGYPSMMALVVAAIFILLPVQLGILLIQGKKTTGKYTLKGVLSYMKPVVWWQVILSVLIVVVVMGVIFTSMRPVDAFLQKTVFSRLPTFDSGLDGAYSKSALVLTYSLMAVFGVVLGPLVEELYFRGFLLPRTPSGLPVLLHTFLFAIYHTWTPWMFLTRTIGMLPLVFAVKKKNLLVGIVAHIFINIFDLIAAIVFISTM